MTYYFGFEPTEDLSEQIDHANHIISSGEKVTYYPIRNKISQQIGRELIDSMLVNLISFIPDPERQEKMRGLIIKIEHATESMLNMLLGKDKNHEVIPNFEYMKNETVFEDNSGVMRVGFQLKEATAKTILEGFEATTPESVDKEKLTQALFAMKDAVLEHFIIRFAETLPLGLIKRKSVPIAKSGINKIIEMAIHRLLPQLSTEALNRLVDFYRPFIVKK